MGILEQYDDGIAGDILAAVGKGERLTLEQAAVLIDSPYERAGYIASRCNDANKVQDYVTAMARWLPPKALSQLTAQLFTGAIVPDENWV